jgi:MarR family 2-MHQ and catechol resistance regulon transcriptional repressor
MKSTKSQTYQDSAIAAYVKLVRTAETLHGEVSRGLTPNGLTASQFSTLKVLKLRGAIPQKEIATYLLKTGGNVTVVVDNLERMGLVQRARDKADRRLVFVSLSASGEELFDNLYPAHRLRIEKAMNSLSTEEFDQLTSLLNKLHTQTVEALCTPTEADDKRAAS